MFVPPPPPAPPALTAEQHADLDCLNLGLTLQTTHSARRPTLDLSRIYLERLKKSDPKLDWESIAAPLPDAFTYDDFVKRLGRCEARAREAPKAR
ncbi:MAG: hypothetical protein JSR98_22510 [Proteobacteria bacterium]|nr:hypothetical protein [Pseudomonadota bacterium]